MQVVQASQPNSGSYYTDCVASKNAAFRGFWVFFFIWNWVSILTTWVQVGALKENEIFRVPVQKHWVQNQHAWASRYKGINQTFNLKSICFLKLNRKLRCIVVNYRILKFKCTLSSYFKAQRNVQKNWTIAIECSLRTADAFPVVASLLPKNSYFSEGEKRRPEMRLLFAG